MHNLFCSGGRRRASYGDRLRFSLTVQKSRPYMREDQMCGVTGTNRIPGTYGTVSPDQELLWKKSEEAIGETWAL